ncbi:MAG: DUF1850 domain-containing protein [Thiolinea sp.]
MSLCILAAGQNLTLAVSLFTLSWTHSVEKTGWQERWQVTDEALLLQEARVKGSGAGMEPGDDAVLQDGWWVWEPQLPPLPELRLAASGATGAGWRLCYSQGCLTLAETAADPVLLRPCAAASAAD